MPKLLVFLIGFTLMIMGVLKGGREYFWRFGVLSSMWSKFQRILLINELPKSELMLIVNIVNNSHGSGNGCSWGEYGF